MFHRYAVQVLHRDEALAFVLADFVDRANVRMVQGRGSPRFATEALQSRRVFGDVVGQKFQRSEAAESDVFGLVNHPHSTATEFLQDVVMRNCFVEHGTGGISMLLGRDGLVNRALDMVSRPMVSMSCNVISTTPASFAQNSCKNLKTK